MHKLNAIYDTGLTLNAPIRGQAWIVGDNGTLISVEYSTSTTCPPAPVSLNAVNLGIDADLNDIAGSSASHISIAGDSGTYGDYDGSQWTMQSTGVSLDFTGLTVMPDGTVLVFCEACLKAYTIECPWPAIPVLPTPTATLTSTLTPTITITPTYEDTPVPTTTTTLGIINTPTATPTFTITRTPDYPTPGEGTPGEGTPGTIGTLTPTPTFTNTQIPDYPTQEGTPGEGTPGSPGTFIPTPTITYDSTPGGEPSPGEGTPGGGTPQTTAVYTPTITRTPGEFWPTPTITSTVTLTPTPQATVEYNDMCCTRCCNPDPSLISIWYVGPNGSVAHRFDSPVTNEQLFVQNICVPNEADKITEDLNSVSCFTNNEVWIAGNKFSAVYSIDGGDTWTQIAPPLGPLRDFTSVFVSSDGTEVYFGTRDGLVYIYDRILFSWKLTALNPSAGTYTEKFTKIQKTDLNEIWVLGESGHIFYSPDNGTTWVDFENTCSYPVLNSACAASWNTVTFKDISIPGTNEVYITGTCGVILHFVRNSSGCGGFDIRLDAAPGGVPLTDKTLNAIKWYNATKILAVGDDSTMLYYNGVTWSIPVMPPGYHLIGICDNWICPDTGVLLPDPTAEHQPSGMTFDMECGEIIR